MAGMQQKLCRIGFAEHFLARRNGVVDRFPLQAHPYPTLHESSGDVPLRDRVVNKPELVDGG